RSSVAAVSLVTQLRGAASLGQRFSYCLVPHSVNISSALNFGALANVTVPGAASTPLVAGDVETYYTMVLDSVEVSNKTVASVASSRIVVDSGTTLTFLDPALMGPLVDELSHRCSRRTGCCSCATSCPGGSGKQTEQASPDLTLEFGSGDEAGERVRDGAGGDAVLGDRGDDEAAAGAHPREPRAAEHPRRLAAADCAGSGWPAEHTSGGQARCGRGRWRRRGAGRGERGCRRRHRPFARIGGVGGRRECERGGSGGWSGRGQLLPASAPSATSPALPSQASQPPPPPFSRVVVIAAGFRASPTVQPRGRTRHRSHHRPPDLLPTRQLPCWLL
ncbi:hypothetical protein EE612_038791, partial [Oryza sativa]